ncbi:unnamed protein product, partial [Polarella glacialis]
ASLQKSQGEPTFSALQELRTHVVPPLPAVLSHLPSPCPEPPRFQVDEAGSPARSDLFPG